MMYSVLFEAKYFQSFQSFFILFYCNMLLIVSSLPTQVIAQDTAPEQEIFSEQELKKFVEINKKVSEMEHTNEDKMIEAIRDENLEVSRFNTLLKAQQNNELQNIEASAEELAAFHMAAQRVQRIQQTLSVQVTMYVNRVMGIEKYKSIMYAYQQSPEVRTKIERILHY